MAQTPLAKILRERGITQGSLAQRVGVTRQAVSAWIDGARPRPTHLKAIAEALELEPWQITGERPEEDPEAEGERIRIPVLNIEAACGGGAWETEPRVVQRIDLDIRFVRSLPGVTGTSQLEIINAQGDSMEPTIQDKAFCLIDRNQRRITRDGIYCIFSAEQLFLKRVQRNLDGSLTLLSDNPLYESVRISAADMERTTIIGRLVYVFNGSPL